MTITHHIVSKRIESTPDTISVVLGRYCLSNGSVKKLHTPIPLSYHVSFSPFGTENITYQLTSIVCHKFICCDDTSAAQVTRNKLLSTAYIAIYNRAAQKLPEVLKRLIICQNHTDVFQKKY